jgi:hypothetical protein
MLEPDYYKVLLEIGVGRTPIAVEIIGQVDVTKVSK